MSADQLVLCQKVGDLMRRGRINAYHKRIVMPSNHIRSPVPRHNIQGHALVRTVLLLSVILLLVGFGIYTYRMHRERQSTLNLTDASQQGSSPEYREYAIQYRATTLYSANDIQEEDTAFRLIAPEDQIVGILERLAMLPRVDAVYLSKEVQDRHIPYVVHLSGLRTVDLRGSNVSDDGIILLKQVDTLEEVYLPKAATDETLSHLSDLKRLRVLSIRDTAITNEGLRWLDGLEQLESLNCYESAITDRGLEVLASVPLPNLRELLLGFCNVTDDGMQFLVEIETLEVLDLYHCKGVSDAGLMSLRKLPNLKRFAAGLSGVSYAGAAALEKDMEGLHIDMGD